jgi:phosphopantetheine adenylyltransferase
MRKLAEGEILSLTTLLKMEQDNLTVAKGMQNLISDDALKKQAEAGILAMEGRIKGIQQFINENQVTATEEVQ